MAESPNHFSPVKGRAVSLREVERQTGISNEYLSQLERGVAASLRRMCFRSWRSFMEHRYESLLIAAGYLKEKSGENANQ